MSITSNGIFNLRANRRPKPSRQKLLKPKSNCIILHPLRAAKHFPGLQGLGTGFTFGFGVAVVTAVLESFRQASDLMPMDFGTPAYSMLEMQAHGFKFDKGLFVAFKARRSQLGQDIAKSIRGSHHIKANFVAMNTPRRFAQRALR